MALTYALSTWPFLEAYLKNKDVDPLYGEQLIDAATRRLERETGTALVLRSFTEKYSGGNNESVRGGARRIYLRNYPIGTVTSIADDQDTPATVASTDYTVFAEQGYLLHDGHWPVPQYAWNITYTGGRFADTASVDEDVRLACHALVAHFLSAPQGAFSSESSKDGKTRAFIPPANELPPLVADLIQPYRSLRL